MTGITRIPHWIDGRASAGTSGRTAPVFNPATGEQTGEVDLGQHGRGRRRRRQRPPRPPASGAQPRCRSGPRCCSPSASCSHSAHRRARRDHHRRARQGALRRRRRDRPRPGERRVRHRRAAPAQGRLLASRPPPASTSTHPPAARRGRRHHPVQLPGHGAAVDVRQRDRLRQRLHPQAQREGPVGGALPGAAVEGGRPARRRLHGACSGDKEAVDAILDAPRHRRGELRRLHPDRQVHLRDRHGRTASGSRPSAAPRTTCWSCPTPTSTWPPTPRSRPPTARRASAAWRSRSPSPSATSPTRSSTPSRRGCPS